MNAIAEAAERLRKLAVGGVALSLTVRLTPVQKAMLDDFVDGCLELAKELSTVAQTGPADSSARQPATAGPVCGAVASTTSSPAGIAHNGLARPSAAATAPQPHR